MEMSEAITIEQNQENSLEIPPFVVKMNIRNDKNKRSSLKQPITSLNMKNGSVSDTYERNSREKDSGQILNIPINGMSDAAGNFSYVDL
jgi:hypothetical protein